MALAVPHIPETPHTTAPAVPHALAVPHTPGAVPRSSALQCGVDG